MKFVLSKAYFDEKHSFICVFSIEFIGIFGNINKTENREEISAGHGQTEIEIERERERGKIETKLYCWFVFILDVTTEATSFA